MWLPYDDKYDVSSDGEVRHRKSGRITRGVLCKSGYYHHSYKEDNKMTFRYVHRMVAERFCPKIDLSGLTPDHINRDKSDNRASNLRWADKTLQVLNRDVPLSKSGHRYIQHTPDGVYKIYCTTRGMPYMNKRFKTLEEAITARDNIINTL